MWLLWPLPFICALCICLSQKNQVWHVWQVSTVFFSKYCITWVIWLVNQNTSDSFQHVTRALEFWPPLKVLQRSWHVTQGSKGQCVPRAVPLNPSALIWHIVAAFSTLMPSLSRHPMEVIRHALFMFDHSTSKVGHCDCLVSVWVAGGWDRSKWHVIHSGVFCETKITTMRMPTRSWEGCPTCKEPLCEM